MEKRLQEIEARKNELLAELENELTEERIAAIETEQKALTDEEAQIRKKMDIRGRLGNVEQKAAGAGAFDEKEERARKFVEQRATTIASGAIATPTSVNTDINPDLNTGNSILDIVKIEDCNGMSGNLVPYEKPGMAAGVDGEGQQTESDAAFDYAKIEPVTVDVYTEVSNEVMKLTPVKYLAAIEAAAKKALRKKIAWLIVASDSNKNTKFFGINKAAACVTVKKIASIDADTLRDIILSYGGDEDVAGAAVLILSKKDLQAFGAVRGTNEKKAVYEIIPDTENPNSGIIKDGGLSCRYTLNKNMPSIADAGKDTDCMYYGKPLAYEVDIFSDFTIKVSEDAAFKKRMLAVLGEVMVGGNVVVYDGFIKVQNNKTS